MKNKSLITPQKVDHLPQSGSRLALSISDPHNPQPYLQGNVSNYLLGTQPTFESKRGEVEENVYGIWVDRGRGIVVCRPTILNGQQLMEQDLHYWTYYPFNFGKPTPLGWLGHRTSHLLHLSLADEKTYPTGRLVVMAAHWY
jgi:hypothetical protein